MSPAPTVVAIDDARFWSLAKGHPVHHHVSVVKALRDAGVPVLEGLEFRGVESGKLTMWNERREGKLMRMFEWTPGDDSELW